MDPRPFGRVSLLCGLAILATSPAAVHADLIYLQGGGGLQVPAAVEGDRITLKLPSVDAAFRRDDFRAIVPGFVPAADWPSRIEAARRKGSAERYAAAWWALENGLVDEAAGEFRALNRDDPRHTPSLRIVAALDRLKTPSTDPDNLDGFERSLGVAMTRTSGPHVVFLHQHDETEARERVELLERIVTAYYMLFAGQGIELAAPAHRLVSACFADHADYLNYLHSQKADAFKTTMGYFHPTWNAVVAYDGRSGESHRNARRSLDSRRAGLERAARTKRDHLEAEVRLAEIRLDLDRTAIDLGTATHETIHQLVANSGLLPRHDAFPIWMHEGFAAQFEVIRGGRWAGISRAHDLRLPDWRRIHPPPRLEPLIGDSGYGKGYQRDLYAQAWALVYFLRTRHPERLLTFVDLLRTPSDDPGAGPSLSAGRRAADAFHRAFGNELSSLEREWHTFLNSAQTPLEHNDPGRSPRNTQ